MTRQEITIKFTVYRHHLVATASIMLKKSQVLDKRDILDETKRQLWKRGDMLSVSHQSKVADDLIKKLFPEWNDE